MDLSHNTLVLKKFITGRSKKAIYSKYCIKDLNSTSYIIYGTLQLRGNKVS